MIVVATQRWPKRATLVLALAIFAAVHVPTALSDSFAAVVATTAAWPAYHHAPA